MKMCENQTDLLSLCRTCMDTKQGGTFSSAHKQHSIFDKLQYLYEKPVADLTIMELLQSVQPHIQVCAEDNLPKVMCLVCIKQLHTTHEFLQMCRDTDGKFRKLLKEFEGIGDETEVDFPKDMEEFVLVQEKVEGAEAECGEDKTLLTNFGIDMTNEVEKAARKDGCNGKYPEFEAILINNRSMMEDDDISELSDNPFSNAIEEDDDWILEETSTRKSTRKKSSIKCKSNNKTKKDAKQLSQKNNKSDDFDESLSLPPTPNDDGSINCIECEKVLINLTQFQEHMLEHRSATMPKKRGRKKGTPKHFECEHCKRGFTRRSVYNTHVLIHTGDKPYKCIECGKKCKSYSILTTHMLCHKGERFECQKCKKEFPIITEYNDHMLTHKGDQPYQCKECGKEFKSALGLSTHILRHKGEKNIQCPHCPQKFIVASGLYNHMKRQHEEAKPHLCDICGKAFSMADMLTKHKRWHSATKDFACEFCDKRFVTLEKQRRHMRTHTGEKPYRCKFCDRAYAQSNDCNKHMKQHLGENIYQCELCPLRFPFVKDVRVHYMTHKDDDEETRARNLEARALEEKILKIKFGIE